MVFRARLGSFGLGWFVEMAVRRAVGLSAAGFVAMRVVFARSLVFVMACGGFILMAAVVAAASALALAYLERVMMGSRGLMAVSAGFLLRRVCSWMGRRD